MHCRRKMGWFIKGMLITSGLLVTTICLLLPTTSQANCDELCQKEKNCDEDGCHTVGGTGHAYECLSQLYLVCEHNDGSTCTEYMLYCSELNVYENRDTCYGVVDDIGKCYVYRCII